MKEFNSGVSRKKVIKVLIVDDSALVRAILKEGLNKDPEIKVVGTATDPFNARDLIVKLRPDVLTLDVEMPKMDGVEFLRKLMPQFPLPIVMVSSLTQRGKKITIDALDAGAVDFVSKPLSDVFKGLTNMMDELRQKVKLASKANVSHWKNRKRVPISRNRISASDTSLSESTHKVIAIGASTGGTEAIKHVITKFPATFPGIVIVQHMPPGFTQLFAEKLDTICAMSVKEAENGDTVLPGKILIAPGDKHLEVYRSGGLYKIKLKDGEKVSGHRPSVDVMFNSVSKSVGGNAIGVILTGMGRDGAAGMLEMKNAGAKTIAQNENSCVVYGMPKEAVNLGGVDLSKDIQLISQAVVEFLK